MMAVTFDPHLRMEHLKNYVTNVHLSLPPNEARVQLLRCRLVAYRMAAELKAEGMTRAQVDRIFSQAYENLTPSGEEKVIDPYEDPCTSQYMMLEELKSYINLPEGDPIKKLLRLEFKKVFVPTLRLLTDLCPSRNKYAWEEVKVQLEGIMEALGVDADWPECEVHLERYLSMVKPIMPEEVSSKAAETSPET